VEAALTTTTPRSDPNIAPAAMVSTEPGMVATAATA
jgi:hypothetical protein